MTPPCTWHLRVNLAQPDNVSRLREIFDRECRKFGNAVASQPDGTLSLQWSQTTRERPHRTASKKR
jgi:hypothetical protein